MARLSWKVWIVVFAAVAVVFAGGLRIAVYFDLARLAEGREPLFVDSWPFARQAARENTPAGIEVPMYQRGLEFSLVDVQHGRGLSSSNEYVVLCRSSATTEADAQPNNLVPKGSALVGRIRGIEAQTTDGWVRGMTEVDQARSLAVRSIEFGDGWIAWKHNTLRVSLDRCATWLEFVPWRAIPHAEVRPSGRPCNDEECARLGFQRISFHDFRVERDGKSAAGGRIGFTLRADTLADSNVRRITSDDAGKTWKVSMLPQTQKVPPGRSTAGVAPGPAQFGDWQPDVTRYTAPAPVAPLTEAQAHALTDEELANIPIPWRVEEGSLEDRLIAKIKNSAKYGNLPGVKAARVPPLVNLPGSYIEQFRTEVVRAMEARAARAALERVERIAASAAANALTEEDLAKIPVPPLAGPQADQILGMQEAAKVGNVAHIKGVLSAEFGDEVDRFKQAVLSAMAVKSDRVREEQLRLLQQSQSRNGGARVAR